MTTVPCHLTMPLKWQVSIWRLKLSSTKPWSPSSILTSVVLQNVGQCLSQPGSQDPFYWRYQGSTLEEGVIRWCHQTAQKVQGGPKRYHEQWNQKLLRVNRRINKDICYLPLVFLSHLPCWPKAIAVPKVGLKWDRNRPESQLIWGVAVRRPSSSLLLVLALRPSNRHRQLPRSGGKAPSGWRSSWEEGGRAGPLASTGL